MGIFREIYGRQIPADPYVWHKWNAFWPVRCLSGRLTSGYVWRQKTQGGWKYQRRHETDDEWIDRQI